jgi:hypothetical protein
MTWQFWMLASSFMFGCAVVGGVEAVSAYRKYRAAKRRLAKLEG